MGNCQAAEAATVVIEYPGGKVERVYWSVSASEVMGSNPGHYIAVVVAAPPNAAAHVAGKVADRAADGSSTSSSSAPVRHLKLLRPDDTLHIGHVYRLISFEEVLKELAAKKHVKLSRLLLAQKQHEEKKKRRERSGSTTAHYRSHDGALTHSESSSSTVLEHPQQQQQPRQASRPREGEEEVEDVHATRMGGSRIISGGRHGGAATRHGQWRPSLQSIAEAGN